MTDTATLDRVVVLLIEARDHLYGEIDALDDDEINARARLDEIIGRRAQRAAALTDLEQLIANHHTSNPSSPENGWKVATLAALAS